MASTKNEPIPAQEFYTLAEAARFVRLGETTIRDAARAGDLPVLCPSPQTRVVAHKDLVAWIESRPTRAELLGVSA